MMGGRVMLHPIIGVVQHPWPPEKLELLLVYLAILQPMELQVHCFGAFWLDSTVDGALCHQVVCLYQCRQLQVSHFFKYLSLFDCFACIDVKCP